MSYRHLVLPLLIFTAIVVSWAVLRARRRRADATPGLHAHPERLNQMLDSSDDA